MTELLQINSHSDIPVYRQLVDAIRAAIKLGKIAPGEQLPTVIHLAEELGLARGTIQRAYDELERLELVEKIQGKGTFACLPPAASGSRKEQAMDAIDRMLDRMEELGFSGEEISIFLDLKLRERASSTPRLKVAVIECNPENLSQMARQLRNIEDIELYSYQISHVEAYPYNLGEEMDLIVTTAEHVDFLRSILPEREKIARVALRLSPASLAHLFRLPSGARVGILGCSRRFGDLLCAACGVYARDVTADEPAVIARDLDWSTFLAGKTALLVPEDVEKYLDDAALQALRPFADQGRILRCAYEMDEGSFLSLQEKIDCLRQHA